MAFLKDVLSGLAGSSGNILGSVITNAFNASNVSSNNKLAMKLAGQANQWNIDQWYRENQYNTPANQMQRLRNAGLNPSLAMTGGSLMNEAAASPQANLANTEAHRNQQVPMIDPLTAAQIRNLDSLTRKNNEESDTEAATRQALVDKLKAERDNLLQSLNESIERVKNLAKDRELTDAQIEKMDVEVQKLFNDMFNDNSRLQSELKLNEEQIKLMRADVRKKLAEAEVSERELYEASVSFVYRLAGIKQDYKNKVMDYNVASATFRKLGLEADSLLAAAEASKAEARRIKTFDRSDSDSSYVFGDFITALIEKIARTLGHIL